MYLANVTVDFKLFVFAIRSFHLFHMSRESTSRSATLVDKSAMDSVGKDGIK